MRLAIIDLGTNSVRIEAHEVTAFGESRILYRKKKMVRLGDGVFKSGKLKKAAVTRALQAFQEFSVVLNSLKIDRTVAFATCALRSSQNAQRFIDTVRTRFGISIQIISGEREAKLIAKGILNCEKTPNGLFLLVDIGGGSTEVSLCRKRSLIDSYSFEIGSNRLEQMFLKSNPPTKKEIEALRVYVRRIVIPHINRRRWPEIETMIGSSGTIRALRKIIRRAGGRIDPFGAPALKKCTDGISGLTLEKLKKLPGIEPRRVDLIIPGAILLDELVSIFKTKKIYTTEFGLRHGILENEKKRSSFRSSLTD